MKKFTLAVLALCLLCTGNAFSQKSNLKGNGEVFYLETFDWANPDDPRGWTAGEGFSFEDPDDTGFNWHWYPNDSLNAQFTREPAFRSSSAADGHLCLFLNLYNNYADPRIDVNNSIVFPTFDCSSRSSVIVRYETHFMAYSTTAGMEMLISNDAGVHWASYNLGFGCGHKERPNGVPPGEPAIFEANITDVAAGMSDVIIKIRWSGTSIYFWLIDDFQLAEAFDNDLRLRHYTVEWDDGNINTQESYSYNLPISQIGGSYTNFEASKTNFGEMDQWGVYLNVDITKNNQSIWNKSSETMWMPTLMTDTTIITESFTPTEFGHYKMTFDFKQEENEQSPENDMAEAFFNITDSVYSRCDDTAEEPFVWGLDAYGTEGIPNEQHFVGAIFPIYGDVEVDAISAFITGGLADGEIEFRTSLYRLPDPEEEDQTPIPWLNSEVVLLDSAMFNTWVTLPLEKDGESEFLLAGDIVYAGLEYWNWHTENIPYKRYQNLAIGADRGINLKDPVSIVRTEPENAFGQGITHGTKLMIRMILNDHSNRTDGVDLTTAGNLLNQNYPNPFTGSTEISYEIGQADQVTIQVMDMTGRVVLTLNEGMQPAGSHTCTVDASGLEAGMYFYTLKAGSYSETKRMILK